MNTVVAIMLVNWRKRKKEKKNEFTQKKSHTKEEFNPLKIILVKINEYDCH